MTFNIKYNKYSLDNLNSIYYNIDKYNSKIYNSDKIKIIIYKKKQLINKYNILHKVLNKYLKYNLTNIVTNNINIDRHNARINELLKCKISNIKYEILYIEKKIIKIEWEENLIMKTFKIYSYPILNNLKSIFKCFY